jgi:hypothetical protein
MMHPVVFNVQMITEVYFSFSDNHFSAETPLQCYQFENASHPFSPKKAIRYLHLPGKVVLFRKIINLLFRVLSLVAAAGAAAAGQEPAVFQYFRFFQPI